MRRVLGHYDDRFIEPVLHWQRSAVADRLPGPPCGQVETFVVCRTFSGYIAMVSYRRNARVRGHQKSGERFRLLVPLLATARPVSTFVIAVAPASKGIEVRANCSR